MVPAFWMGRKTSPTTPPRHSRISAASVKSILSSAIRASAASSFASFLETFFIGLPLMWRRFSRRNNPYVFLSALFTIGMCNKQQYDSSRHSHRLPALLSFFNAVRHAARVRLLEHQRCGLETHPVLHPIRAILRFVPVEDHRCTYLLVHTISYVCRDGVFDFSTDFHNSFESQPSRKPFPSANLNPTVSNRDAHSNNNIVILDSRYFLCYHVLCWFVPILDSHPTVSRRPRRTISPLQHYVLFFLPYPSIPTPAPVHIEHSNPPRTFLCSDLWTFQRSLESLNPLESIAIFHDFGAT